jgi:hypothetical protein
MRAGNTPATAAPANASDSALDSALDGVAPELKKWATICVVTRDGDGGAQFNWRDYRDSGNAVDFWPASAIKLYAVVAALELINERGFPLDTAVIFERRENDGGWVLDCARSMREMISEVFRRSSNEDYTLLLRLVGIDRINTEFLTPAKGFSHSALMRGYVTGRPYGYVREEPQRLSLRTVGGEKTATHEHAWSGRFYAEERGPAVIDARTGNVTSLRELVECLRRVMFYEQLPEADRYQLTTGQLEFIRHGGGGLTGLETRTDASGPSAWKNGLDTTFPDARFYHKSGLISDYALEVAYLDDAAKSGKQFLFAAAVHAGSDSKPARGDALIGEMARRLGEWVKSHQP